MNDKAPIVDSLLMITGFTYSLANIEHILGIIILIIQIVWLCFKAYIKIRDIFKDGVTTEEIPILKEEVENTIDDFKDIIGEENFNADNT